MPVQHIDSVAMVYARSLFELAEKVGGLALLEEINDEFEQLVGTGERDPKFREFLSSPIIDATRRSEALDRILQGRITDLFRKFVLVLNEKGRMPHFRAIARAYDHMLQARFGRVEVDVHTATEINQETLDRLAQMVREGLGREPVFHKYVEPELLGGIKVRIGDVVYDRSVAGQLIRLRESLLANSRESIRSRADRIVDAS